MKWVVAWLVLGCAWTLSVRAQIQPSAPLIVEAGKSEYIPRPGVNAAYSLDSDTVQVQAEPGGFRITGKYPGSGTVVLVTPTGAHPVTVTVTEPPRRGRAGPGGGVDGQTVEFGHFDIRYNNSPNQFTGFESVTQIAGDRQINIQVMNTDIQPGQGETPLEFPLVSYEVVKGDNRVTVLDKMVDNTDLTINQAFLRGLHFVHGPWEFHSGITSMTQYQDFLLPTQRVEIAGLSRHFQLSKNALMEGNLYYFKAGSDAVNEATTGPLATAYYQYSRGHNLLATAELGLGRGFGVAGKLERDTGKETVHGYFRYQSPNIASLSISQLHGRMASISWTDKVTKRLLATFNASDTGVNLAAEKETVDTAILDPVYWITRHVGITSGLTGSRFLNKQPAAPGVRSAGYLAGPQLLFGHFGGSFQLQSLKNTGKVPDSLSYGFTAEGSTSHAMVSVFYDAQSQAPVFAPVSSSTQPGLGELLNHESQMAQTPQQMSELVQQTAGLSSQGYIQPLVIVLAAQRTQYGITIDSSGEREGHLMLQGLINSSSGGGSPALRLMMGSATWAHKMGLGNVLNAGFSLYRSDTSGQSDLQPVVQFSWEHQLNTIPRWVVPGRRGSIDGHVFVDNQFTQTWDRSAAPLADVLVYLDGRRTVHTDKNGYYAFHGVPWGVHSVQVDYHDSRAFYYTSSSPRDVPTGATADFGISFAKGRIFGKVTSDAGDGLQVQLSVEGRGMTRQVSTDGDGNIEIDGLPDGPFAIRLLESSVPPGYSLASLEDQNVTVTATRAGNFKFVVPAQRSIAGTVQLFDPTTGAAAPLAGAIVAAGSVSMQTDSSGRYLFRNLPAGPYSVTVMHGGKSWTRTVQLAATPDIESGVDIMITQPSPRPAPSPAPAMQPLQQNQNEKPLNHRRERTQSSLRERERMTPAGGQMR